MPGGMFLLHFPQGHPHWSLASIPLYGVRTFLGPAIQPAIAWFPQIHSIRVTHLFKAVYPLEEVPIYENVEYVSRCFLHKSMVLSQQKINGGRTHVSNHLFGDAQLSVPRFRIEQVTSYRCSLFARNLSIVVTRFSCYGHLYILTVAFHDTPFASVNCTLSRIASFFVR